MQEIQFSTTRVATYANIIGFISVTSDTVKLIIAEHFTGDPNTPPTTEVRGAFLIPAQTLFDLATTINKLRPVTVPAPVSPSDAPTPGHLPGETFP